MERVHFIKVHYFELLSDKQLDLPPCCRQQPRVLGAGMLWPQEDMALQELAGLGGLLGFRASQ